jgi:hypothetical protein
LTNLNFKKDGSFSKKLKITPRNERPTRQQDPPKYFFSGSGSVENSSGNFKDGEVDRDQGEDHKRVNMSNIEIVDASDESFIAQIRKLNPDMDPSHNWLATRVALQQEIRYQTLLKLKIQHSKAIDAGNCPAARHCRGMNESINNFNDEKPTLPTNMPQNVYRSILGDINIASESVDDSYPLGIPVPPISKCPAEFECQICFKVKKFQMPTVSHSCPHFHLSNIYLP